MVLDGDVRIITQGSFKLKKEDKTSQNIKIDQKESLSPLELMLTPMKESQKIQQEELGSTSLRKTVFKNHYADKMKEMGT